MLWDESESSDKHTSALKNYVTSDTERQRMMREDTRYNPSQKSIFLTSNKLYQMVKAEKKGRRFELFYSNLELYINHPEFKKCFGDVIKTKQDYFMTLYNTDDKFIKTLANFLYHLPLGKKKI